MANVVGLLKTAIKQLMRPSRSSIVKNCVGCLRTFFAPKMTKNEIKALSKKIPEILAKEFETFDKVYKPVMLKDGRMRILTKQGGEFHRYLFAPGDKMRLVKKTIISGSNISTTPVKNAGKGYLNLTSGGVHNIADGRITRAFSDVDTIERSFLNGTSETQKVVDRISYYQNKLGQWTGGNHELIITPLFNDKGVTSNSQSIVSGFFSLKKPMTTSEIIRACRTHSVPKDAEYITMCSSKPYTLSQYRHDILRV